LFIIVMVYIILLDVKRLQTIESLFEARVGLIGHCIQIPRLLSR
jgi:hypothetical protein